MPIRDVVGTGAAAWALGAEAGADPGAGRAEDTAAVAAARPSGGRETIFMGPCDSFDTRRH